jgi:hypothetical protein
VQQGTQKSSQANQGQGQTLHVREPVILGENMAHKKNLCKRGRRKDGKCRKTWRKK